MTAADLDPSVSMRAPTSSEMALQNSISAERFSRCETLQNEKNENTVTIVSTKMISDTL